MPISKDELVALSDEEKVHVIYDLQELLQAKIPNNYSDSDEISQEEITMMKKEYDLYKKNPSMVIQGEIAMQVIRGRKHELHFS